MDSLFYAIIVGFALVLLLHSWLLIIQNQTINKLENQVKTLARSQKRRKHKKTQAPKTRKNQPEDPKKKRKKRP